jgi:hypothetical protein
MKRHAQILAGILWFAAFAAIPAHASSILIYISPPGAQSSEGVAGATVENFDSMTAGNRTTSYTSLIGTYNATSSSPFDIIAPDQYGGADDPTNPKPKYFDIGDQSGTSAPVSVTLYHPADYFGFWLSATDVNNGVSFYDGNYLLGRFSAQMLLTFLNGGAGRVTAIDNTKYNTSAYFGNPNAPSGRDTSEPFVFVNFVAQGIKFDRVVFDNSNSTGTGFESDNHTVSAAAVTMSGDHVLLGTMPADTPEPAAAILVAGGLILIAVGRRRGPGALRPR